KKPLFWKFPSAWPAPKNRPDHWVSSAVVHQQWKLVANRDLSHAELYRITDDPYEANDVAQSEPEVTRDLLNRIKAWKSELPEKPSGNVFSSERLTLRNGR
ncbi:MAG: hypothetical protein ACI9R3_005717, partial [Verrucomicrobiales bacterium]